MHNNRNSRERNGATEQYFCISYGAEVCSPILYLLLVIFERLGINVCVTSLGRHRSRARNRETGSGTSVPRNLGLRSRRVQRCARSAENSGKLRKNAGNNRRLESGRVRSGSRSVFLDRHAMRRFHRSSSRPRSTPFPVTPFVLDSRLEKAVERNTCTYATY